MSTLKPSQSRPDLNSGGSQIAAILSSIFAVGIMASPAQAAETDAQNLSVNFEARQVALVQSGDFHFKPGQIAPIHTHEAPAIGYVSKGEILYQVEGRELQLLKTGDVFYEPAGPRILRFDNASPTEEAIFVDFNLQQKGEPFIAFEKPPTEAIDRRTLPEAELNANIDGAEIESVTIQPGAKQYLDLGQPVIVYVAEGTLEVRVSGQGTKRFKAGENFYLFKYAPSAVLKNASSSTLAKAVVFSLHKS